jgi:hypothetical protein
MITGLEIGHAPADLLDDPGPFVPEHDRWWYRQLRLQDRQIGVAYSARGELDDDLTLAQGLERERLDLEWLHEIVHDSAFDHVTNPPG